MRLLAANATIGGNISTAIHLFFIQFKIATRLKIQLLKIKRAPFEMER
jgi:hypothetical protein